MVQASGAGGVFDTFDTAALQQLLEATLARGKIGRDDRLVLRSWARCLGADAGAGYLEALIASGATTARVPPPSLEARILSTLANMAAFPSLFRQLLKWRASLM